MTSGADAASSPAEPVGAPPSAVDTARPTEEADGHRSLDDGGPLHEPEAPAIRAAAIARIVAWPRKITGLDQPEA